MSTLAVPSSAQVRTAPSEPASTRIPTLDILRGFAIVVMAVDHVRVYFSNATFDPTDLAHASVGLFLTRWITHFAAPGFVFLAGTGAYLYGQRGRSPAQLSRFLLTRGLWLIVAEMTIVRFGWTFNFDYAEYLLGGVLWMIGWCMIIMAGLVRLPVRVVGAIGVTIIAGHNVVKLLAPRIAPAVAASPLAWLARILYYGGPIELGHGGPTLAVLFVIVPWIGVMAAGYAFGAVMQRTSAERRRICLRLGLGMIAAFLLLRVTNVYGDQRPWSVQPRGSVFTALSFLNTSKYPASLCFLLMTLGPMIAVVPFLERAHGWLARVLATFGRVPFFFYILHIPLIHALAVVFAIARYGTVIPWLTANHPMAAGAPPDGYGYSVPVLWLLWLLVVALLYIPCAWFAGLKARRRDAWLSYL